MTDILIVNRNNKSYITPETEVAKRWLERNTKHNLIEGHIVMDRDLVEDFIKYLIGADLSVEVK